MKKVLITGGSGFIGANLAQRLVAEGHAVHLLLRPSFADWRLRDLRPHLSIHVGDLAESDAVDAVLQRVRPDWVFHLAAHGAYSFQNDIEQIVRTNYLGTTVLVQACLKIGVEIVVHAGSSSEYRVKDSASIGAGATGLVGAYGATKAAATQFCRSIAGAHQISIPTLRLYSVYGPYEDPRRLFPALIVHGVEKRWPPLASPTTARDFVYVDDVCDAFLAVAQNPPADPGAIYNVGSGRQTTLRELVALAAEFFRITAQPSWNSLPSRPWDTDVWISDPTKIKAEAHWSAKTDLSAGLGRMAEWLQADPQRLDYYREHTFPRHPLARS
jgi:UDP-glucose 4-epimerase